MLFGEWNEMKTCPRAIFVKRVSIENSWYLNLSIRYNLVLGIVYT